MKQELNKLFSIIIALSIVLFLSVVQSLKFGIVDISFNEILQLLGGVVGLCNSHEALALLNSSKADIIFDLRMPRIIMAIIAGGSLSLSGVVMQAILRNPLADSYILGISSGAALGATSAIVLGAFSIFGSYGVAGGAFLGALGITCVVFAITFSKGTSGNTTKLILAGTALNAICGSCTSIIVYTAKDIEGIRDAAFWIMGSMAKVNWNALPFALILFICSALFFIYQYRTLNASLMGDEMAVILGVRLEQKRKIYLIIIALLVSVVVACVGIIGFVGLIIPHIVRIVLGNNHLKLLPVTILLGAIYMIWCDVLARSILPTTEIPIGILTSLLGGPFFLYLMMHKKYGFGDN